MRLRPIIQKWRAERTRSGAAASTAAAAMGPLYSEAEVQEAIERLRKSKGRSGDLPRPKIHQLVRDQLAFVDMALEVGCQGASPRHA